MQKRNLPPLELLQAFEAAGRTQSFRRASEELHLTPSAISHRVARLEDWLGDKLFERRGRGIDLTATGRTYLVAVQSVLNELGIATDRVRDHDGKDVLTLRTYPVFARYWLIKRTAPFLAAYPDVELNLISSFDPVDFTASETDVAIGYGTGTWRELVCDLLVDERIVPVCSPGYLDFLNHKAKPADANDLPLIHCTQHPEEWARWLEFAEVGGARTGRDHWVTTREFALVAAANGMGVAMGHSPFVEDLIREGSLVAPFDLYMPTRNAYFFVTTKAKLTLPLVATFRDWIVQASDSPGQRVKHSHR